MKSPLPKEQTWGRSKHVRRDQEGTQVGVEFNPAMRLVCYKNFITCAKKINCFRILLACWFVALMQIPRNEFACKFQGKLYMGQKVIWVLVRIWVIVYIQESSHYILQTFRPLRIFKIVFRGATGQCHPQFQSFQVNEIFEV